MKSKLKKQSSWLLAVVIIAGLLALLGPSVIGDQVAQANSSTTDAASLSINAKNENPGVLPPNSKAFGKSYGEWSAEFWKWLFSMPVDQHPLFETADCSQNQAGKVWFLGGTFTTTDPSPGVVVGKAARKCTVPTGKAFFFPIINLVCSEIEGDGTTEEELREECANFLVDTFVNPDDLSAKIDGVEIDNLQVYRADSPLFTFGPLPDPNLPEEAPGSTSIAVADGYYLLLAPLSKGEHTIDFAGRVVVPDVVDFSLDISYELTVVN